MMSDVSESTFLHAKQMYLMGLGIVFDVNDKTNCRVYQFEKIQRPDGTMRLEETGTIEFRHDVVPVFRRVG